MLKRILFQLAVGAEKLNNKEVRTALKLLREHNISRDEFLDKRNQAFSDLIRFVSQYNPYYKDLLEKHGLDVSRFKSIEDISKLPYLTKSDIKKNRDRIVTPLISDAECITRTSGGTTGEPIYIQVNKQARINELYAYYRGMAWMGWNPGDSMVKFFGGSLGGNNSPTLKNKIKKWVSGELFIPAFGLTKETAPIILEQIRQRGRTFLQGYVSAIYTLATYSKELNFKGLQIMGAFTTAEQLPSEQAEFIQDVFKCPVKSFYGCAEINSVAFQPEMSGPYIVAEELVHIENIKHPETGIENSFLLTSLYNYKTPLIRYLNGDNGKLGKKHSKYSTIDELSGRSADMFIRKDGSYISSIVATQTMQITGLTHKIKRYQLIQDAFEHVRFDFETFENTVLKRAELQKILDMYQNRLGSEFKITPRETNQFIKSKSGKHRLMINLIRENR